MLSIIFVTLIIFNFYCFHCFIYCVVTPFAKISLIFRYWLILYFCCFVIYLDRWQNNSPLLGWFLFTFLYRYVSRYLFNWFQTASIFTCSKVGILDFFRTFWSILTAYYRIRYPDKYTILFKLWRILLLLWLWLLCYFCIFFTFLIFRKRGRGQNSLLLTFRRIDLRNWNRVNIARWFYLPAGLANLINNIVNLV